MESAESDQSAFNGKQKKKQALSSDPRKGKTESHRGLLINKVKKVIQKQTVFDCVFNEKLYLDDQGILWDVPDVQVFSEERLSGIICFASDKGGRMWQHCDTLRLVGLLMGAPVSWALLIDLQNKTKSLSINIQGKSLARFTLSGDRYWTKNLKKLIEKLAMNSLAI